MLQKRMMMVSRDKIHKDWLTLLQPWHTSHKEKRIFESSKLQVDVLLKQQEELIRHVISIKEFLENKGVKEALKDEPSIGKLLSMICKIPYFVVNAHLMENVLLCMLKLSGMLDCTNNNDTTQSRDQRATDWAATHFSVLTSFYRDDNSVDLFLMEEFGVSQQEYMQEHLKQVVIDMKKLLEDHFDLIVQDSSFQWLQELQYISNDRNDIFPMSERLLQLSYSNRNFKLKKKHMHSFVKRKPSLCVQTLAIYYSVNYKDLESLVYHIFTEAVTNYPTSNKDKVDSLLNTSRLKELMKFDPKFHYQVLHLLKKTLSALSDNLSRCVCLVQSFGFMNDHKMIPICCEECHDLKLNFVRGLENQDFKDFFHSFHYWLSQPRKKSCIVDVWLLIVANKEFFDEVFLSIFHVQQQSQALTSSFETVLFAFYPKLTNVWTPLIKNAVKAMKELQDLRREKSLQNNDMQQCFNNLKRSLKFDNHALILSVYLLFIACYGTAESCSSDFLIKMKAESCHESLFWMFYVLESLLERKKISHNSAHQVKRLLIFLNNQDYSWDSISTDIHNQITEKLNAFINGLDELCL